MDADNKGDTQELVLSDDEKICAESMWQEDQNIIEQTKQMYRKKLISGYRIINGRTLVRIQDVYYEILFIEDLKQFQA